MGSKYRREDIKMTIVIKTQDGNLIFNPTNIYVTTGDGEDCYTGYVYAVIDSNIKVNIGTYVEWLATDLVEQIFNGLKEIGTLKDCAGCMVFTYEMPKEFEG